MESALSMPASRGASSGESIAERAEGAVDVKPELLARGTARASAARSSIAPISTVPADADDEERRQAGRRDRRRSARAAPRHRCDASRSTAMQRSASLPRPAISIALAMQPCAAFDV